MQGRIFRRCLASGLIALAGCKSGGVPLLTDSSTGPRPPMKADEGEHLYKPEAPRDISFLSNQNSLLQDLTVDSQRQQKTRSLFAAISEEKDASPQVQPVSHESFASPSTGSDALTSDQTGTLSIDGRAFRVKVLEELPESKSGRQIRTAGSAIQLVPGVDDQYEVGGYSPVSRVAESGANDTELMPMDMSSALQMIGGQHPAVGFAQWKVQEAYARLDQAEVLWLPSIRTGFSFNRHDGNYQASSGRIVDVNRNSFQLGLGNGAVGAGSTPNHGIVAEFHLADAMFQPDIAKKTAWAHGHSASGVYNKQLNDAAIAYLDLLEAEQGLRILEDSLKRTSDLAELTRNFAITGQGLQADANRMETEEILLTSRIMEFREQADVASARLSQVLSVDSRQRIVPVDHSVVPIELVSAEFDQASLISTGLTKRPELKEAQALVSAACDQYQRQRYAPFVPSVLLGFSAGGFGGGNGDNLSNFDDRVDFDAMMAWEIRNLGFGEKASRRETLARVEQAKFERVRLMDQVAREVTQAHSQVTHRRQRVATTETAIKFAQDSFNQDLSRIREGQGLPIEALQSVRGLENARMAYLKSIVEYNKAQFQLQWAMGWPLDTSKI